jgi:hypothetical protein
MYMLMFVYLSIASAFFLPEEKGDIGEIWQEWTYGSEGITPMSHVLFESM